ncbi:MAG: hypothetical protein ACRDDM_07650 [Paraclostridium sp.]
MKDFNKFIITPIAFTLETLNYIEANSFYCLDCNNNYVIENEDILRLYGGLALQLCKECVKKYETCTQYCTSCECEVELENIHSVQNCPHCENEVYPCSLCDMDSVKCSECQFNKSLTVVRAMKNIRAGHLIKDERFEYLGIDNKLNYRASGTTIWRESIFGLNVSGTYEVIK